MQVVPKILRLMTNWGLLQPSKKFQLEDIFILIGNRTGYTVAYWPQQLPVRISGVWVRTEFKLDLLIVPIQSNNFQQRFSCLQQIGHIICEHDLVRIPANQISISSPNTSASLYCRIDSIRDAKTKEAIEAREVANQLISQQLLLNSPLPPELLFDPAKLNTTIDISRSLGEHLNDLDLT